ncbi:MAG: hypothetical protein U1D00_18310 [Mycobacterium sp.]|nr:hypothetical protein [Mycobacterium sp.]
MREIRIAAAVQLRLPWEQECVAGSWEQVPEPTRAQVLSLLARMIARGVLAEDGSDG